MILYVPLITDPNQSLNIQLEANNYTLILKSILDFMTISIIRNNVPIVLGQRAVAGSFLIPYRYLEDGNFYFLTQNQEYPDYRQFTTTQNLVYISDEDLEAVRDQIN